MAAILASAIRALEGSVMRPARDAFVDCAARAHVAETRETKTSVGTRCIVTSPRREVDEPTARLAVLSTHGHFGNEKGKEHKKHKEEHKKHKSMTHGLFLVPFVSVL